MLADVENNAKREEGPTGTRVKFDDRLSTGSDCYPVAIAPGTDLIPSITAFQLRVSTASDRLADY